MIHQYRPQRYRIREVNGIARQVGTIPVGTVLLVRGRKVRVEAWIPRDYASYERGRFTTKRIVGGHLALVRNLHNNAVFELSDAWLRDAIELDADDLAHRAIRRHTVKRAA